MRGSTLRIRSSGGVSSDYDLCAACWCLAKRPGDKETEDEAPPPPPPHGKPRSRRTREVKKDDDDDDDDETTSRETPEICEEFKE